MNVMQGQHLLTEQVMTQTFLGFCLSQLCMFLHTANRLWRLGAWREGQLHSDTWGNKRKERWMLAEQQFTCHEESSDRNTAPSPSRGAILAQVTSPLSFLGRFCQWGAVFYLKRSLQKPRWDAFCSLNCNSDSTVGLMTLECFYI